MNLVLLKNISLVGLYWGAYSRKQGGYLNAPLHPTLTNFTEREAARVPAVWEGLLSYVFVTYNLLS